MFLQNLLTSAYIEVKGNSGQGLCAEFFLMNSLRLLVGFTVKCRCTDEEPIFYIRRFFLSKGVTKKSH